jgi:hypothetical protein
MFVIVLILSAAILLNTLADLLSDDKIQYLQDRVQVLEREGR